MLQRAGLQWDREFAVMKPDGEVLTQKVYPALAKIQPALHCAERQSRSDATASARRGCTRCASPSSGGRGMRAGPGQPGAELSGITLSSAALSSTVHVDLTAEVS